ncbi:amino acid adenylation domain-containing protein [Streptomyces massasporeus]|uniref:amino acid adenylation domain-containing protein n=1 Tax=Streptomyces massasporeus TaxID=67324 RepID=UPI0033A9930A
MASFAQQRLWLQDQLAVLPEANHVPVLLRLRGALDEDALRAALAHVIERHEPLRTRVRADEDGTLTPVIDDDATPVIERFDLSARSGTDDAESTALAAHHARAFDLAHEPPMRTLLIDRGPDADGVREYALLVVVHHIAFDGWSAHVMRDELCEAYAALIQGRQPEPPALPVRYRDVAAYESTRLDGDDARRSLDYWQAQLAGLEPLGLTLDAPERTERTGRGGVVDIDVPDGVAAELRRRAEAGGPTLYAQLLTAWQVLLHRHTSNPDIAVGTPVAGRTHVQTEPLIGCFVNTLVIRGDLSGDLAFEELTRRTAEIVLDAVQHQDVPFEQVVERVRSSRDESGHGLFQALFALEESDPRTWELPGVRVSEEELPAVTAAADLDLYFQDRGHRLTGRLSFARDVVDPASAARLADQLGTLLADVAAHPRRRVSGLLLAAPAPDLPAADLGVPVLVHEVVGARARSCPEAVAVVQGDRAVSFGELEVRANRLAHRLVGLGVGPDVLVGVCLGRSAELLVALLAVMKAGGAYVPLDPEYPVERLRYIQEDTGAPVVITDAANAAAVPPAAGTAILRLDELERDAANLPATPPDTVTDPDNLAYISYTSGSTGRPKGVAATHRAVQGFWTRPEWSGIGPEDTVLALAPLPFDVTTYELWCSLFEGARVALLPPGPLTPDAVRSAVTRHGVTVLSLTTGLFNQIAEGDLGTLRGVRRLLTGGDVLSPEHVRRTVQALPDTWVGNSYGPTECTTFTYIHPRITEETTRRAIPLGRPIGDSRCHILDEDLRLVPPGAPGELYIGGSRLARGYLNAPAATAERFLPDPFVQGERMYQTGDRVRLRSDGELDFLGRLDKQVKIRGYRVEPGEIEACLLGHPSVARALVVAHEHGPDDRRLVAYVGPAAPGADDTAVLRAHVERRLPAYMVPWAFVRLDALPLDPNGKVDRKALPLPAFIDDTAASAAPHGRFEEAVAAAWAEVLGLPAVGRDSDFFELGGHSLLVTRVTARLRERMNADIPLRTFFTARTVRTLAAALAGAGSRPASAPRLTPRPRTGGAVPLSAAQRRMWITDQHLPVRGAYHVPIGLRLRGDLDRAALHYAVLDVVDRHEALRSVLTVDEQGEPAHIVRERADIPLVYHDLRGETDPETALAHWARGGVDEPFDLTAGGPLRILLARTADDVHVLLVVVHHIAFDGVSYDVLLRELAAHYGARATGTAADVPELEVQYADYAHWQHQLLEQGQSECQLAYWRDALSGLAPLELPTDHPRPARPSGRGATIPFELPAAAAAGLRKLARDQGTTVFTALLTAWQTVLHRYSGQDDIAVGCVVEGRGRHGLENLIGFFVNTLVMRADFRDDPAFTRALAATHERLLAGLDHQDLPFDRLVEALRPPRDAGRTPFFQAAINFRDAGDGADHFTGLRTETYVVPSVSAKFDLLLYAEDDGQALSGALEFATDLFTAATAERLVESLTALIADAVDRPASPVGDLAVLTAEARHRIVHEWNDNTADLGVPVLVHEVVGARARSCPEAVAVVQGDRAVSFGELEVRANRLAHRLVGLGVGPDVLVGVCLGRSAELLVALLAVMKAGGAYVPLDPEYPVERLRYIQEDTGAPVVITDTASRHAVQAPEGTTVLDLDRDAQSVAREPSSPPVVDVHERNLVYAIYTSGSTGRPKGVQVEHIGLSNYILWARDHYPRGGERATVLHSSISFDLTVPSLFEPLVSGRTLTVLPPGDSLEHLARALVDETTSYDYIRLTPSHLRYLRDWCRAHSTTPRSAGWVVGGEVLEPELVSDWLRLCPGTVVVNHYAPTEVVIGRVMYFVPSDFPEHPLPVVPLGRPMHNSTVYVLDSAMRPVPPGVLGELYMGGLGVTRGYAGRPGLTADRFVPDPFGSGGRLYRTGDHARQHADGAIEFVGRVDHQIKIRGFRIEPGEIEARLSEHPAVDRCLVNAWTDTTGDQRLAAYWVQPPGADAADRPTVTELRTFLAHDLPDYMIPAAFVALDAFPLNPHGKIDRHALPAPDVRPVLDTAFQNPRTPGEAMLSHIWARVLDVDQVGIDDNFFELGGDSIKAVKLTHRCVTQGIPLTPRSVFETQTVRQMADAVTAGQEWRGDGDGALEAVFGAARTGEHRSLVGLAPEGDRTPLFCVHPSGGSVGWYLPLAKALPAERPLYAFQPPGMDNREAPLETVEAMAACYIKEMRGVQKQGPYALLGWSLGGTIAFEMARQLRAEGERVEPLLLLEPSLPGNEAALEVHREEIGHYLRGADLIDRLAAQEDGPERAATERELRQVLRAAGFSQAEVSLGESMPLRACAHMLSALGRYEPDPCAVGARLLATDECLDASPEHPSGIAHESFDDYLDTWRELVGGTLTADRAGGVHSTMLSAQHIDDVAVWCEKHVTA